MGCLQSADDKRRETFLHDWSLLEFAMVKGFNPKHYVPVDYAVCRYLGGEGKDFKDKIGEFPLTEDKAKEIVKQVWDGMKVFVKELEANKGKDK